MIPNKDITRLPWNMYKFINRKPSIFSSAEDKMLYKLLIVWLNEEDEVLSNSYIDQANMISCLHWRDFKQYSQEFINSVELKYKQLKER